MDKIFVVKVRGWDEHMVFVDFSFHRTKKGAENSLQEAMKRYATNHAWIEEEKVQE